MSSAASVEECVGSVWWRAVDGRTERSERIEIFVGDAVPARMPPRMILRRVYVL